MFIGTSYSVLPRIAWGLIWSYELELDMMSWRDTVIPCDGGLILPYL
ncbi:MAG: hypothetical protein ACMUJM_23530 [bacterium]